MTSGDMVEEMRAAIWSARQDPPQSDYALKMRLSYDEATRAAQAAATIAKGRMEAVTPAMFEAGNAAQHPDDCTDVREIYLAMTRAALKGGDA